MKWILRISLVFAILTVIVLAMCFLVNNRIQSQTSQKIKESITEIPAENPPRVALVFGAKVQENGELSNALYDRVITAVELYRANRVGKILMSGARIGENYDEPTAMKTVALKMGIPEPDIVLDFEGRRTLETCSHAKEILQTERAIIVTQKFHQPRALYICESFGIESIGITADLRQYENEQNWAIREFFSTVSAWFEINFLQKIN